MKKVAKILGLLVVLSLLVSLVPVSGSVPASAAIGTLKFDSVAVPSASGSMLGAASEASDIAITSDGKAGFVVDRSANRLYRSTTAATSLSLVNITANLVLAAGQRVDRVVTSPDDPNIVVVVATNAAATNREVVLFSSDQGTTWSNTSFPALAPFTEEIADVAISSGYPMSGGTARDIAVVTRDPGGFGVLDGRVFILQLKTFGVGGWSDQAIMPAGHLQSFVSVAFAPAYAGDFSVVVLGAGPATFINSEVFLHIGVRQINANTTRWDAAAITAAPPYPVRIRGVNDAPGVWPDVSNVITGDIALPADFSGQVDRLRRIYVAFDDGGPFAGGIADVFRVDSTRVTHLQLSGVGGRPYSIAYSGSYNAGKLIATQVQTGTGAPGKDAFANVSRSLNPQSSSVTWEQPYKAPTAGAGIIPVTDEARTMVIWTPDGKAAIAASGTMTGAAAGPGDWAIPIWHGAATANDESAISRTADDGDSWNGIRLIDTTVSTAAGTAGVSDFVVSGDEKTAYLATWNTLGGAYDSIWKGTSSTGAAGLGGSWERVLAVMANTPALPYTSPRVKLAPDKADGSVVFWADQWTAGGNTTIQRSINGGQTWSNTLNSAQIQDFVASDQNTLFVLAASGKVSKGTSTGPGWLWAADLDSQSGAGSHTITALGNVILVGGGAFASISQDGGATFARVTTKTFLGGGAMHVAIDPDFAKNKTIFVAGDAAGAGRINRWIVGTSGDWEDLTTTAGGGVVAGSRFGIAAPESGVVYVADNIGGAAPSVFNDQVNRTLDGLEKMPKPGVFFDNLQAGLPVGYPGTTFTREPQAITVTGKAPAVNIWAINVTQGPAAGGATTQIVAFTDTLTQAKLAFNNKPDAKLGGLLVPVTAFGSNAAFGVHWDVVSLSRSYQVQISTDDGFSDLIVNAAGPPANPTAPSNVIGNGALLGGQAYYARVRVTGVDTTFGVINQAIRTRWSAPLKIMVAAGAPIQQPYGGAQALAPQSGASGVPIQGVGFSWSGTAGATEYSFVLATDAALVKTVVTAVSAQPAYVYDGKLTEGTVYFWQVQATKPVPAEKSPVFSFTTFKTPPPVPTPPPAPPQPTPIVNVVPAPATTPSWVWVVIGIGALLVIVTIVLIFRTRRV